MNLEHRDGRHWLDGRMIQEGDRVKFQLASGQPWLDGQYIDGRIYYQMAGESIGIPINSVADLQLTRPRSGYVEPRCPDCGCSVADHNAVNTVSENSRGPLRIAHCAWCGACWRSTEEFTELVFRHLTAEGQK